MLPSTRICISAECQSKSRIISSVKELENHMQHQTSSLSQLQGRLLQRLTAESMQFLQNAQEKMNIDLYIHDRCQIMHQMINQVEEQMVKTIREKDVNPHILEGCFMMINQSYFNIENKHLESIVRLLNTDQDLDKFVSKNLDEFAQLQEDFKQTLDQYFETLLNVLNDSQYFQKQEKKIKDMELQIKDQQEIIDQLRMLVYQPETSQKQDLPQKENSHTQKAQSLSHKFMKKFQWVPLPESYQQVTRIELCKDLLTVKHVEGVYTMVIMNRLLSDTAMSQVKIRINQIQDGYVGVGLGLVHRDIIEKTGLIITAEAMQETGHGVYMMYNDGCVYSHIDKNMNGAENGKDKGFKYQNGDVITIVYNPKSCSLYFEGPSSKMEMRVKQGDLLFAAWLDFSEIQII